MISRMGGGVPGAMGGGYFFTREIKYLAFFQTRKVSKFFKNSMNIYNFLKLYKEILRFFKMLSKFSRKFREIFRKFCKYAFVGVRGAEPLESNDIIKNVVEKSMETCPIKN